VSNIGITSAVPGQPLVSREKNRLIVRAGGPGDLTVRLFSLNGKLLASADDCPACGGCCSIGLPRGSSIAVIRQGAVKRIISLASVD
jgi:hypothetical protein